MTNISLDLRSITPTLCSLLDISMENKAEIIEEIVSFRSKVDKILVFAADALGVVTHQAYPEKFQPLYHITSVSVDLLALNPPVTPVCFGSMFSGLLPTEHGITSYRKPIIEATTIFDSLIQAGKKVAIIAVKDSSIGTIFGLRELDYYLEKDDLSVLNQTLQCLESDNYDFILAYQQKFDDVMHRTTPNSIEAQQAIDHHIQSYISVVSTLRTAWNNHTWLSLFVTDHGTHIDRETGKGTHGQSISSDLETRHFFTFSGAD